MQLPLNLFSFFLIIDPELLEALMDIMPDLKAAGITVWVDGREEEVLPAEVSHFDTKGYSGDPVPREIRQGLSIQDVCAYIFTSGTTGRSWHIFRPKHALVNDMFVGHNFSINIEGLAMIFFLKGKYMNHFQKQGEIYL